MAFRICVSHVRTQTCTYKSTLPSPSTSTAATTTTAAATPSSSPSASVFHWCVYLPGVLLLLPFELRSLDRDAFDGTEVQEALSVAEVLDGAVRA